MDASSTLTPFLGKTVVVDVEPPVVYIGILTEANPAFIVLTDADVHALWNSSTSREVYLMEVRRNGVQPTRRRVMIKQSEVLSLSLLDDIVLY